MHIALRRLIALLLLAPGLALAHPSPDHVLSFTAGVSHPLGGIDHLLAMIAVGLLAAKLQNRALWILPLTFMGMLTAGALVGVGHGSSPVIEVLVAASIVAFGGLLALKSSATGVAVAPVALFALAHGYAHGSEALSFHAAGYLSGMLLASAALHALGIGVVVVLTRFKPATSEPILRVIGAALTLAGVGILFA